MIRSCLLVSFVNSYTLLSYHLSVVLEYQADVAHAALLKTNILTMLQTFVDQLAKFYHLLYVVKSNSSLLADCSPVPKQSRRLLRLVKNLIARRHSGGLCRIIGQLERLGGPVVPSVVVPRLRRSRYVPDFKNRAAVCRATLNITQELSMLLSCMRKFYRQCSL